LSCSCSPVSTRLSAWTYDAESRYRLTRRISRTPPLRVSRPSPLAGRMGSGGSLCHEVKQAAAPVAHLVRREIPGHLPTGDCTDRSWWRGDPPCSAGAGAGSGSNRAEMGQTNRAYGDVAEGDRVCPANVAKAAKTCSGSWPRLPHSAKRSAQRKKGGWSGGLSRATSIHFCT